MREQRSNRFWLTALGLLLIAAAAVHDSRVSARIVGGQRLTTMPEAYRPVVWILFDRAGDRFYCTGTLVATQWVVTAAHCVENVLPSEVSRVVFDTLSITETGAIERTATEIQMHPQYEVQTRNYDAALLKLNEPVAGIVPLALGEPLPPAGQALTAVGYGVYGASSEQFGALHEGVLRVGGVTGLTIETQPGPAMICGGDSGGPLLMNDLLIGLVQVGIASFGDEQCQQFGVFTRVSAILEWIDALIPDRSAPTTNLPPEVRLDVLSIPEGGSIVVQVAQLLANDVDPEGTAVSFVGMRDGSGHDVLNTCSPVECSIDISRWGDVTDDYYAAAGMPRYRLKYVVADQIGARAQGEVELRVLPLPDAPVIRQLDAAGASSGNFDTTIRSAAHDPDVIVGFAAGDGFRFAVVPVLVSPGDGSPAVHVDGTTTREFVHRYAAPGRYTLTATATDADGTVTRTAPIQVTAMDILHAVEGVAVLFSPAANDGLPPGSAVQSVIELQSPEGYEFEATCDAASCGVTWPIGTVDTIGSDIVDLLYTYSTDGIRATGVVRFYFGPQGPTLSLASISVAEGLLSRTIQVPVTLSEPSGQTVVLTYSTAVGSATEPGDYRRVTGATISIPAGQTSASLPVRIVGDWIEEPDEAFIVTIDAIDGAAVTDPSATVTLINDDDRTPPVIAPKATVVVEAQLRRGQTVAVSYEAPLATDAYDGTTRPATCLPPSGWRFPLGKTTVTCIAVDRSLNFARSTFDVVVRLPH